jgi:nucleotide-binding universal stress UspA family protein
MNLAATNRIRLANILVATDFSEASERALEYASAVARRNHSQVHLLHVIQPTANDEQFTDRPGPEGVGVHEAERRLQSCAEGLRDISLSRQVAYGDVREIIKGVSGKVQADLIVIGTRGRKGLRKLVRGSVAEAIFRDSESPVLIVGPSVRNTPPAPRSIIYAADPLQESHEGMDYAVALAEANNASLTLVYVVPSEEAASKACRRMLRSLLVGGADVPQCSAVDEGTLCSGCPFATTDHHAKTAKPMISGGIKADYRIIFAKSPVKAIIDAAREIGGDLIVLDVRQEEAWLAAHLFDNAYRIVAQSPCPVLTVGTTRAGVNLREGNSSPS